uniref:Patatin n=1 Tax=Aegilops tauschii subsp. strangulata TaxID=200361 RepID=A0A453MP64_AEGTS
MASNKDAELETPLLMPEEEEGPTAPLLGQGSPEPTPRPRLPPPKFGELITVLSIDGGGIHGLIPTVVLKCLEEKLQAIDGEDARIADYFDVIAGMSAGAIIATMLAAPNTNNRTKYTPQEIQDFYVKNGPNMFPSKRWWRWPLDLLSASWGPKYDGTFLQKKKTKEVTGEHTLSKLAAPTFDANILEPLIFSSFQDAVQNLVEEAGPDLPDVCIGPPSTATPTYFPAHYFDIWVSDMEQSKYHLIDGGNNPTMAAISKITREQLLMNPEFHPSGVDYMKYLVISVGAGCAVHENVPAKRGAFNWFHSRRNSHSPVTDTFSHTSAVLADWQVRMLLHNGNCVRNQNYLYIQALVRTYIC